MKLVAWILLACPTLLLSQSLTKEEAAAVRAIDQNAPAAIGLLEKIVDINSSGRPRGW